MVLADSYRTWDTRFNFKIGEKNIFSMIGHTAHILFLKNEDLIKIQGSYFAQYFLAYYFVYLF